MVGNLKEFYQDVEGEQIADEPSSSAPAGAKPSGNAQPRGGGMALGRGMASSKAKPANVTLAVENDPAQMTIDAGKQYEELAGNHKALVSLLDQAKSGNSDALNLIIERYGFNTDQLEITITEPLRDAQGREPEQYGIKLIHSDAEWEAIARDWETASAYFPQTELHNFPTTRRGKRLAVVMGDSAHEFNAVIAAERRRARLEGEMQAVYSTIEKGRKDMGVDKAPRIPTGGDKKPLVETPSQGKVVAGIMSPTKSR
jgi:hypothetical protein